jgi:hypothetical protein
MRGEGFLAGGDSWRGEIDGSILEGCFFFGGVMDRVVEACEETTIVASTAISLIWLVSTVIFDDTTSSCAAGEAGRVIDCDRLFPLGCISRLPCITSQIIEAEELPCAVCGGVGSGPTVCNFGVSMGKAGVGD